MNEAKKFLSAARHLMVDHGVGNVGFIEYASRMAALIKLIDEARTPIADKALSFWLESGTPHCKGWLREQSAEVILQSGGPVWVVDAKRLCISGAIIDTSWFSIRTKAGEGGKLYAAGMGVGVEAQEMLDKMSDCITSTSLDEDLKRHVDSGERLTHEDAMRSTTINMTVNVDVSSIKGAIERGIGEAIYPLREECADAAQWLVMNGVEVGCGKIKAAEWLDMRDIHKATWIICTARKYLDALNAKRQPLADAAWFLLEHGINDWAGLLVDRSASHILECARARREIIDELRKQTADKARDVYFKRVGVPSYIQGQMMVMGWDWIETEWLSLQAPKRCGTRITVRRLGTAERGAEFGVAFYKGGVAFHEERFSGHVSMGGSNGYRRNTGITDYDEFRVVGDACVSVEALYESR